MLISSAGVLACDRAPAPGNRESTVGVPTDSTGALPSAGPVASGWNVDAGPFLVLPTVDGGLAAGSVLRPESTELTVGDTVGIGVELGDGQVELFARGGRVGTARLTVESASRSEPGCTAWPVARLAVADGSSAPWTAAFAKGRVVAIALDSIEGLSSRDSTRLAVDLARLASALPDDTVATFRGLPFVVLRAWRTKGLETDFIVATLARRVNQEDAPREERLVVVVDQTGADSRKWAVAWHERASGSEDELVVAEPLLAFRAGRSGDVHLLFGRDDGVALGAAVLTRGTAGWRLQWESAVAGCN
ncbi:MAG: hypothetical protein IPP90_12870 [Gemmatimonadaceae bacterium]|nr:hypothetical protein [Gemmatimonadaceae bacterium]